MLGPGDACRSWVRSSGCKIPCQRRFRHVSALRPTPPGRCRRPLTTDSRPAVPGCRAIRPWDRLFLALLGEHKVLTTSQLVRLTAMPERTVQHRLGVLYRAGLVSRHRPRAAVGTSPYHVWLTAFGAAAVGVGPPQPWSDDLVGVSTVAALSELWLGLRDHGPSVGLTLTAWFRLPDPLAGRHRGCRNQQPGARWGPSSWPAEAQNRMIGARRRSRRVGEGERRVGVIRVLGPRQQKNCSALRHSALATPEERGRATQTSIQFRENHAYREIAPSHIRSGVVDIGNRTSRQRMLGIPTKKARAMLGALGR